MRLLGIACLVTCAAAIATRRNGVNHRMCDPSHFGLQAFHGYRVQVQTTWTARQPYFFTRITRCVVSEPVPPDAYVPTLAPTAAWNTPVCTGAAPGENATCYLLVPYRTGLAQFLPGAWLGGLYRCPEGAPELAECTIFTAWPIAPLLAEIPSLPDRPQLAGRHLIFRRPIMLATDVNHATTLLGPVPRDWPDILANAAVDSLPGPQYQLV